MCRRLSPRWLVGVVLGLVLPATVLGATLDELKELIKGGKFAEAESGARTLLASVDPTGDSTSLQAADVIDVLVDALWRENKSRPPETRALADRAVKIRERESGPDRLDTAVSVANLANVLYATGDYAAARPAYERVIAIREKALGPDDLLVADSLFNLAVLLRDTADYPTALSALERALAIRQKQLPPDHPDVARSLNGLGVVLQKSGDYTGAKAKFEAALAILEKSMGPENPAIAGILANLGLLDEQLGDYAAARSTLERVLAIREKALGSDHPRVAKDRVNLAMTMSNAGDYAAARPLFDRALAALEKALGPDHPDLTITLGNYSNLLTSIGDYAAARTMEERALAIDEKTLPADHPQKATHLVNLAEILEASGDFAGARPLIERSLAMSERTLGPDHPDVADAQSRLGALLLRMGDAAAARPYLEKGLANAEKALGPDHYIVAQCLGRLATCLEMSGDPGRARALFERALAIREKTFGADSPRIVQDLSDLAWADQLTGDTAAARPLYERAIAVQGGALGPDYPELAITHARLANLRARTGDGAGALTSALEAERISREQLRLTGRTGSETQALEYAAVRISGLDLALTLAAKGLPASSEGLVLDALLRSRAVILDEMASRHRALGDAKDPKLAPLIADFAATRERLANLLVRGLGSQDPEAYRKLVGEARAAADGAERRLAEASEVFVRESTRTKLGLADVAASLPAGSAVVAFTEYKKIDLTPGKPAPTSKDEPAYLAFVLRAGEADPHVVDLGTAAAMDGSVAAWKKAVSADGPEAGYRELGTSLRKRVWDPLASAIGDAARVFVVPDGSINLVSLAALPLDDGGYLIERGPVVHYVSAERDLVPSGGIRHGEGLLALGAPSYDATSMFASLRAPASGTVAASKAEPPVLIAPAVTTSYRGGRSSCADFASARFGPLPATGKETREIVRMWEKHAPDASAAHAGALDLREAGATETALKSSAPGRRVLHLATHGFFLAGDKCESALASARGIGGLAETPATGPADTAPPVTGENPLLLSGLVLAGANHRSSAGNGEDDGILTAEEIASLDLSGVEWAVLSACETGVGDVRAGEGVFGLRRAFQVAGAATLIMSLWSVDDDATRAWMKALYEGRLDKQLDTAEAVHRATLQALLDRRARKQSTHPFYWAAFVAAGDWR